MSNREDIMNTAIDLIHYRESSRGKNRGLDASGAHYTKGDFHITTHRAGDKVYGSPTYRELYSHMSQIEFANFMYDNPGVESLIAEEIVNSTLDAMPYLDKIPTRVSAAIVRSIYNLGGQPNLRRAAEAYATAIETNLGDLNMYKDAVVKQFDTTSSGGRLVDGLVNESHQLREFAMGTGNIEDYDLRFSDIKSPTRRAFVVSNKAKELADSSATGRAILGKYGVPFGKNTDSEFTQWQDLHHHKAYVRDYGDDAVSVIKENRPGFMETVGAARLGLPTVVAGIGYVASKFGAFDEEVGKMTPPTPRPER